MLNKKNKDIMNSWWRPLGSWGLTFNMVFMPYFTFGLLVFDKTNEATIFLGIYAGILSAWLVAYGIRQNGANHAMSIGKD